MLLVLARHGETRWNVEHRYQGQRGNLPLSERGFEQAQLLAQALSPRTFDAVYTSDLLRARQTADAICAGRSLRPIETPALCELDFGEWEGLTYDEIQSRDAERLAAWDRDRLNTVCPGGESLKQLVERLEPFVGELRQAHAEQTVLLVAHGGPLQLLVALSLGLPPVAYRQLRTEPGSWSELYLGPPRNVLATLSCLP